MNNSVFGYTMKNTRKCVDIELITDANNLVKYTTKPTFVGSKIFNNNLVAVSKIKETLTLKRSAYGKMCIPDLSKTLMCDSHCNYGKDKWNLAYPPYHLRGMKIPPQASRVPQNLQELLRIFYPLIFGHNFIILQLLLCCKRSYNSYCELHISHHFRTRIRSHWLFDHLLYDPSISSCDSVLLVASVTVFMSFLSDIY